MSGSRRFWSQQDWSSRNSAKRGSTRVAYNASSRWAVALEEYADFGEIHQFEAGRDQSHQVFGVVNYSGAFEVETGLGFGVTDASDGVTLKVTLARDVNKAK